MNLESIARNLDLKSLTPDLPGADGADVTAGYASDLLSDVLANAPEGGVLVTLQVHLNVVAVASHAELSRLAQRPVEPHLEPDCQLPASRPGSRPAPAAAPHPPGP